MQKLKNLFNRFIHKEEEWRNIEIVFGREFISITTWISAGLTIRDLSYAPIVLNMNCTDSEFIHAIKLAFERCTFVKVKERSVYCKQALENTLQYDEFLKKEEMSLIQQFEYKTRKELHRDQKTLSVSYNSVEYQFIPCQTKSDGFVGIETISLPMQVSDQELLRKVREMMGLCTSIYKI
ncbi:contact-dependent growth inhibition system immunity protein [Acinetobacter sp. WCHAc060025]|uniref:contact-dependent growth inhibition system immunity protein n=1 Tax=Acinetobacter sp. WCHAc060025 TaxID=2518625 RepID=UPI001022F944|nr:contact-dependent growth inhibition system immunity protein [Acinetobacter sp. WCHAc060025]RZG72832.1 DUF1436 family protein [Acinetobacter sp. WCHAc060025]